MYPSKFGILTKRDNLYVNLFYFLLYIFKMQSVQLVIHLMGAAWYAVVVDVRATPT